MIARWNADYKNMVLYAKKGTACNSRTLFAEKMKREKKEEERRKAIYIQTPVGGIVCPAMGPAGIPSTGRWQFFVFSGLAA